MVRKVIVPLLALTLFGTSAFAGNNHRSFGLGIIAGEPTGISMKIWTGDNSAVDGAVAWSFEGDSSMHLHADYIVHKFDLIHVDSGALPMYFGIGGRYRSRENQDDDLGLRVPVGLNYLFADSAFDIFIEIVPILNLAPSTELDLNAALGARFFF